MLPYPQASSTRRRPKPRPNRIQARSSHFWSPIAPRYPDQLLSCFLLHRSHPYFIVFRSRHTSDLRETLKPYTTHHKIKAPAMSMHSQHRKCLAPRWIWMALSVSVMSSVNHCDPFEFAYQRRWLAEGCLMCDVVIVIGGRRVCV
jgi:hypothetical protein